MERTYHRFLQIDMLAMSESHHGNGEMDVIGNSGNDGLKVTSSFLEEFAEVTIALHFGEFVEHFLALLAIKINIAEGCDFHHIGAKEVIEILFSTIANTDEGHFHFVLLRIGRLTRSHQVRRSGA